MLVSLNIKTTNSNWDKAFTSTPQSFQKHFTKFLNNNSIPDNYTEAIIDATGYGSEKLDDLLFAFKLNEVKSKKTRELISHLISTGKW